MNKTKAILTALLILAMVGSAMCAPTGPPDQAATQAEQKAIDVIQKAIDEKGYNWTAGVTSVSGLTDDEKKKLCGVKLSKDQKDKVAKEKKSHPKKHDLVGTYPTTFDWRNKDGKDWMTPVKDQLFCGGCWAFSAIGVVEAKINIQANNPDIDIDLSEQHLVSDCYTAGDCGGGTIAGALQYVCNTGVPGETCFPYTGENCACTPCVNWDNNSWRIVSRNHSYPISKESILANGPSSGTIRVYEDFLSYTGGVYQRTSNDFVGTHAIVIVGWNDAENCWIIKNSWGTDWGEDGYGRITDECFSPATGGYTVDGIVDYIPVAGASVNISSGAAPLTVAFTGTGIDYDGTISSYYWDFGDGASSTSQNPTHTYDYRKMYTATLYVTDDDGHIGLDRVVITNGEAVSPISASASSFFSDNFPPENATDGDIETYWLSGVLDNPCWIMFDFGEQVEINSMYMSPRVGPGDSIFDVSVSNDTMTWVIVCEDVSAGNYETVEVVNISNVRYVKLDYINPHTVEGCREFYAILPYGTEPCDIYDTNDDPGIQFDELLSAMQDFFNEIISIDTYNEVHACYVECNPCEAYDANSDDIIQFDEMMAAMQDYFNEVISLDTMNAVLDCYNA